MAKLARMGVKGFTQNSGGEGGDAFVTPAAGSSSQDRTSNEIRDKMWEKQL